MPWSCPLGVTAVVAVKEATDIVSTGFVSPLLTQGTLNPIFLRGGVLIPSPAHQAEVYVSGSQPAALHGRDHELGYG